jgi:hypothetical protein
MENDPDPLAPVWLGRYPPSLDVAGEEIDLDVYGQLTDRLGRAFGRLGLKRVAREVQTLEQYLAQSYSDRNDEAVADAPEAGSATLLAPAVETPMPGLPTASERPFSTGGSS